MTPALKLIGDYLIELGFVTRKQIEDAFKAQKNAEYPKDKRLGDILIARRLLTRAQLDKAIERQMADQYGIVE
jgi:hypothetical protein